MGRKSTTKESILKTVTIDNNGCWICNRATDAFGYPKMSYKNKNYLAHRLSYKLFVGEIPEGLCVCHKCDITRCINPDHLFLGTHQDNMTDRKNKGRY